MRGKRNLSAIAADKLYGITVSHEVMENGEFRSRITPRNGNGYIRTLASPIGAWQNAHYHKILREIYVVESGWIASAEKRGLQLILHLHLPGEIFVTEPNVVHNIYMGSNSVIHTVKLGGTSTGDWYGDDDLTSITSEISEADIISLAAGRGGDDRFSSYVDLYNNLDKLLWSVPGYLGVGGAVIIGFFGSLVSRDPRPSVSPIIFSGVLFFASLLFFLGYSSMARLREHHSAVGDHLAGMEGGTGYFTARNRTVSRLWPISATMYFRIAYMVLSVLLFAFAILIIAFPELLKRLLLE